MMRSLVLLDALVVAVVYQGHRLVAVVLVGRVPHVLAVALAHQTITHLVAHHHALAVVAHPRVLAGRVHRALAVATPMMTAVHPHVLVGRVHRALAVALAHQMTNHPVVHRRALAVVLVPHALAVALAHQMTNRLAVHPRVLVGRVPHALVVAPAHQMINHPVVRRRALAVVLVPHASVVVSLMIKTMINRQVVRPHALVGRVLHVSVVALAQNLTITNHPVRLVSVGLNPTIKKTISLKNHQAYSQGYAVA